MKYKTRVFLTAAVLLLCTAFLLQGAARADAQPNPPGEFAYYAAEDHVEITGYMGTKATIVVPETIEGKPVTVVRLGRSYYGDQGEFFQYVRKIVLPSTIVKLDDFAFGRYDMLTEVEGLEYVQELGEQIFWATALEEAHFSAALKRLSPQAFNGGENLKKVTLPDDFTFTGSPSLTLRGVEELTLLRGTNDPTVALLDGVLFSADGKTLISVLPGMIKNYYAIPDGTEIIARSALDCNLFVDEYEFPASVRQISDGDSFSDRLTMSVYPDSYALSFFEDYNANTQVSRPNVAIRVLGRDGEETVQGLVDRIVAQVIEPGMTDVQKARALHDWICENGSYDYTYANDHASSILSGGSGVCDAYTRAYCVLLDAVGLESRRLTCRLSGTAHAINAVKLDGDWYLVDCTNDDEGFGAPDSLFCFNADVFKKYYTGALSVTAEKLTHYAPLEDGRLDAALQALTEEIQQYLDEGEDTFYVALPSDQRVGTIQSQALCSLLRQRTWQVDGETRRLECNCVGDSAFTFDLIDLSDDAEYQTAEREDGLCLTKYLGTDTVVTVPAELDGKPVVALVNTFRDNTAVTQVILPEGITEIGASTFQGCTWLREVNFPSTLKTIGNYAFVRCLALDCAIDLPDGLTTLGKSVFHSCVGITAARLPGTLKTVEADLFYGCSNLHDVTLEEGFTAIGDGMFFDCISLKHLTLPQSLTAIGKSAFTGSCLVALHLPAGVRDVSWDAFLWAKRINRLTVSSDNPYLYAQSGLLITRDTQTVIAAAVCTGSDVVIPDGVQAIGEYAFAMNETVTSVRIPGSVKTIGANAFRSSCVENAYIEDGAEQIGDYAFAGTTTQNGYVFVSSDASHLVSLRLPATLQFLGECAMIGNQGLKTLILPDGLTSIDHQIINFPQELYIPPSVTYIAPQEMISTWGDNVIHGIPGTYAEAYANENGFAFVDESGVLALSKSSLELLEMETVALSVLAAGGEGLEIDPAEIVWSSSDGCVTVENGVVTGLCAGSADVTARWGNYTGVCHVDVLQIAPWLSLSMTYVGNFGNYLLRVGENQTVYASGHVLTGPLDQYGFGPTKQIYLGTHAVWTVSDPKVISLSPQGDDYVYAVAIGPGHCDIIATLPSGQSVSMAFDVAGGAFDDEESVDTSLIGSWLHLPAALENVEAEAFLGACAEGAVIPDGCRSIGSRAFAENASLRYVYIPRSVVFIAEDAFENCPQVVLAGSSQDTIQYAAEHGLPFMVTDE